MAAAAIAVATILHLGWFPCTGKLRRGQPEVESPGGASAVEAHVPPALRPTSGPWPTNQWHLVPELTLILWCPLYLRAFFKLATAVILLVDLGLAAHTPT
uniref:Uncharacterized protein n=1 Tax=Oryza glumipatula TaxID=40148 RepID=A0A0D9ZZ83_9ORYZ